MSERPDGADGLGRSSGGTPDFTQPVPPAAPAPTPVPAPPAATRPDAPRPSRAPALVTAVVVLVVAVVTALATLAAWRADTRVTPPPPVTSRPVATAEPDLDAILFTGAHGTGRLTVREHSWETGRPDRLRLSVELACITGTVDHSPDSFQLFDADGTLVEPSPVGGGPGSIGYGTLDPGESVRGDVLFDVSRQVVTLVLSDDAGSVTALRITD